jgi:hypothetical protein
MQGDLGSVLRWPALAPAFRRRIARAARPRRAAPTRLRAATAAGGAAFVIHLRQEVKICPRRKKILAFETDSPK